MRFITKGLLFGHAAGAPVIVFGSKKGIGDFVRTYPRLHRERSLLKTPLDVYFLILLNCNFTHQIFVQQTFQVVKDLFRALSRRLVLVVQIVFLLISIHFLVFFPECACDHPRSLLFLTCLQFLAFFYPSFDSLFLGLWLLNFGFVFLFFAPKNVPNGEHSLRELDRRDTCVSLIV